MADGGVERGARILRVEVEVQMQVRSLSFTEVAGASTEGRGMRGGRGACSAWKGWVCGRMETGSGGNCVGVYILELCRGSCRLRWRMRCLPPSRE